jgi:hypothetical protein
MFLGQTPSMALLLSYLIYGVSLSIPIRSLTTEVACAYVITTLLLAPYLYCFLAHGVPAAINPSSVYSNDLLAFAIPTPVFYLCRAFSPIVTTFRNGPVETAAYLRPGLWIILFFYIKLYWHTTRGRFLVLSLILIGVMSLDPHCI